MRPTVALVFLPLLALSNGEHCEEVDLQGKPFNPRSLIVCRNGKLVRKSTEKSSCPDGWKIWAPETKQDWQTIKELGLLNVKKPHFLVDVTRPENGCGGCRSPMNSNNPAQETWRTSNGEPWWIRDGGFGEPNGDYTANCYLGLWNMHDPNNIGLNDARCNYHSTDYLCTPMLKIDCTEPQYANALTGPCVSQPAVFQHSNCTPGLCDAGSKLLLFAGDTKIEKCKELCDEGRKFTMPKDGLTENWYFFRQNGRFHDVTRLTPDVTRIVTKGINYRSTGGNWPGVNRRDHFYVRWTGHINIKTGGRYAFWTRSDDGSRLYIDGNQIIENGGWHGMRERHRWVNNLASGPHEFVAEVFEGGGGAGMEVKYRGPDSNNHKVIIPGSAFSSGAASGPVLPGIFKTEGPCMGYSISPDSTCMLYTACNSVGLNATCDLNFIDKNLSNFKTCALPPVPTPKPTPMPTPAPPTPAPPNGWIGCYQDNGRRDLKHGPKRYGYTVAKCRNYAKQHGKKYFALQANGWCNTDNTYGDPANQYRKMPDRDCGGECRGETATDAVLRCGGGWRNAMYKTDPSAD